MLIERDKRWSLFDSLTVHLAAHDTALADYNVAHDAALAIYDAARVTVNAAEAVYGEARSVFEAATRAAADTYHAALDAAALEDATGDKD
jgi:hypothetical protein